MPLISYEGVALSQSITVLGDTVYIDNTFGRDTSNITPFSAQPGTPIATLTQAVTIANLRNLRKFAMRGSFSSSFPASVPVNSVFMGSNPATDQLALSLLAAPDLSNCAFENLQVSIFPSNSPVNSRMVFRKCVVASLVLSSGDFYESVIGPGGLIVPRTGSDVYGLHFYDCTFKDSFGNDPVINLTHNLDNLFIAGGKGRLKLSGIDAHVVGRSITIWGNGLTLTIDNTCVYDSIDVYGDVNTINNSGGTVVNDHTATSDCKLTEEHFHNVERTFGISADQSGTNWGTIDRLTPFVVTAGTGGAFGAVEKVLGSTDTPVFGTGSKYFDIRRINITATSSASDYIFRLIWATGSQTSADAIAAGQYTEIAYARISGAGSATPLDLMMQNIPVGASLYAQCACATNGATISFYAMVHEHPSPFGD